ncbi:hypothetical protein ACSFXN_18230 [Planococcus sp. 1R117A]|uniref:hypothetical protein n=1 Tax=Planococcus sp. 1R117A TaxID=3447020 RepID=UPI003EDBF55B
MAINQHLLWMALPNGVQPGEDVKKLKLSVFVNPRLYTDQGSTLSIFPDFLKWGELMQPGNVEFSIEVDDGHAVHQVPADIASAPPDAVLWQTLFHPNIPVRPYQFKEDDLSNRPIVSFSVNQILNYIKDRYQNIAIKSATDLPYAREKDAQEGQLSLEQEFADLIGFHSENAPDGKWSNNLKYSLEAAREEALRRKESNIREGPILPGNFFSVADIHDALYHSLLFHYRVSEDKPIDLPDDTEAHDHFKDTIDFHQMLSALGDFPDLLRMLGLVIDLQVDADSFPWTQSEEGPAKNKIRVVPQWRSSLPARQAGLQGEWSADYSPWTYYNYQNEGPDFFKTFSHGEEFQGIWVPTDEVSLVQVDPDGAALQTFNFAGSLRKMNKSRNDQPIDVPKKIGIPTLRTSGIAVVRNKNAFNLNSLFNRSAELNRLFEGSDTPQLVDLFASDISKGYRIDIFDGTAKTWKSLHERIGTYQIVNASGMNKTIVDEGFAQPSVTSPAKQESLADELYIHESLFTWDGWSLSAPLPGKSISRSPRAPVPEEPETLPQKVPNDAMTELGLETSFEAKAGSLPRLRFGRRYMLRIRTVDLAGNGPTIEEANSLEAVLPGQVEKTYLPKNELSLLYSRFEPVNPPELIPRQLYQNEVDSPETAYTEGESLERLVIRSNFDQSAPEYATAHPAYQPVNERHVAAPKASLRLIEMHGLLDGALNAKTAGLPPEEVKKRIKEVYDLAKREAGTFNDAAQPGVHYVSTSHDPAVRQGYAVHTAEQLELPYLPDPLATGVVFQGLPGVAPSDIFTIEFKGDTWHDAQPFRLQLAEGEGQSPEWNADTRVLTVHLHKSGQVKVRVSSLFGGELEQMGLWQWLRDAIKNEKITEEELTELKQVVLDGRHWMFTPYREITLVHAVQQPLVQPYLNLEHKRFEGSTAAYLHGEVELHVPSTSKVDISAEWKERRDDLTKDEPDCEPVAFKAQVMDLPTTFNGQAVSVEGRDGNCVPDGYSLHVEKEYLLLFNSWKAEIATKCFQQELEKRNSEDLQNKIEVASKVTRHEFGDTKYRRVRYRVSATSNFREYFAPLGESHLSRESKEVVMDILSSARPAAPRVLYTIPTFGWCQQQDGTKEAMTNLRKGGGIRVYLDRPWWSSGDGELLGIVILESGSSEIDFQNSYATLWGDDPIWRSAKRLSRPTPENFNSSHKFKGVGLAEKDGVFADVIGYEPKWEEEKKLWYCDIELNEADAYYPFIRLALARIQPNSLISQYSDFRLSPIVLTDFVQTAPNRMLSVTRTADGAGEFNIAVSGVTYSAQSSLDKTVQATSEVVVQIQKRMKEIADDTIGWSDVLEPVSLAGSTPDDQGVVIWQGPLAIPSEYQNEELRFVIQEFESLYRAAPSLNISEKAKRLVYMDIVPFETLNQK